MKKFLELEGKVNDLLTVDKEHSVKYTRLFYDVDYNEIIDVAITSSSTNDRHPIFDLLLDKDIKVTIEISD